MAIQVSRAISSANIISGLGYTPANVAVTPTILKATGLSASITGTTADTILGYVNVPAGLMGANGAINLDMIWQATGSAGSWVHNIRIITGTSAGTTSGTSLLSNTMTAGNNTRSSFLIANANSASAQIAYPNGPASFTSGSNAINAAAIDTASAFTVSINAKLNNSGDTIALRYFNAQFIPGV